jgi:UDP-N-acetylglucosamine--N-acetylmuramyl-(pentapeptide) pyrophosphoryl-undecaprenol N-acetylglucosamine transferase
MLKLIFACGGTAGHINPAIAIANKARDVFPDCQVLFVGDEGAMEYGLVKKAGYQFFHVKVTGLSRSVSPKGIIKNIKSFRYLLAAN